MKTFFALVLCALAGCVMPLRPGKAIFQSTSGAGIALKQSQNPQQESSQKYERIVEPVASSNAVRTIEREEIHIGAAQKDTAREVGAKLASLKGVVWIGILVFLFGAASFVYPPLKLLVGGSVTTSAVITAAGLALIILPSLVVGNELLILGVALGGAGLYWFAHRHGSLAGALKELKGK